MRDIAFDKVMVNTPNHAFGPVCDVSATAMCVLSSAQRAGSVTVRSSAALAASHFRGKRTMQLRGRSAESAREGNRQDVDAGGTPCITQPVREFGASAAVCSVVFGLAGRCRTISCSGPAPAGFARVRGPLN